MNALLIIQFISLGIWVAGFLFGCMCTRNTIHTISSTGVWGEGQPEVREVRKQTCTPIWGPLQILVFILVTVSFAFHLAIASQLRTQLSQLDVKNATVSLGNSFWCNLTVFILYCIGVTSPIWILIVVLLFGLFWALISEVMKLLRKGRDLSSSEGEAWALRGSRA